MEHPTYQNGIKGAFVRISYGGSYNIGQIKGFDEGREHYQVEQRETKFLITVFDGTKNRNLKLDLISDQNITEQDFKKFQNINKKLSITQDYIRKKRGEIRNALSILTDKTQLTKFVNKQNYDKISRNNFSGLNLTDINITLAGEIFLLESQIREFVQQRSNVDFGDH